MLLQSKCAGVITYTTQQKSEPAIPPRQHPCAVVISEMQPCVHWYLGDCHKHAFARPGLRHDHRVGKTVLTFSDIRGEFANAEADDQR